MEYLVYYLCLFIPYMDLFRHGYSTPNIRTTKASKSKTTIQITIKPDVCPAIKPNSTTPPSKIDPNEILKYGIPSSNNSLLNYSTFIVSYNNEMKQASWVAEILFYNMTVDCSISVRDKCEFKKESNISDKFSQKNTDYINSNYDRGHLAASSNHRDNQIAQCETFYLSNISPQRPKFNRDHWRKLEHYVQLLTQTYDAVYVITGPSFPKISPKSKKISDEFIGPSRIFVPKQYFKSIYAIHSNGTTLFENFLMPNQDKLNSNNLSSFKINVDALEKLTGLELFRNRI